MQSSSHPSDAIRGETDVPSTNPSETPGQESPPSETQCRYLSTGSQEAMWEQLLERTNGVKITGEDHRLLETELSASTCKEHIETLKEKYESRRDSKFLKAIEPTVKGLTAFSDGLNTLTKHSTGLSIGWGVTQLMLESAQHSYTILTHIAGFIKGFTKHLPRYQDYDKMLPEYPRLHEALADIYIVYLEMCVCATAYLKRPPWVNFLRGIFKGGADKRDFDRMMDDMRECENTFNREVEFANAHSMRRRIQALHAFTRPLTYHQTQERLGWPDVAMLPLNRNRDFYSRDDQLNQIKEHLHPAYSNSGSEIRSCVVHGMCGVGKTQLILEFAHCWEGPIFWLEAETPAKLKESFYNFAKALKLDTESEGSAQGLIELARQWLSTHNGWLLIYDNVVSFETIKEYFWPSLSQGSMIISTQNKNLLLHCKAILRDSLSLHLQPMTRDDGATFLLECLKHDSTDERELKGQIEIPKLISDELGGLPLAIAHVARYIHSLQRSPHDVLEALRKQPDMFEIWSVDHQEIPSWQYGKPLNKAWDLPLSALGEDVRDLLNTMTLIGIEEIPVKMLSDTINGLNTMLNDLRAHHMVSGEKDSSSASVYPSLKRDILFRLTKDAQAKHKAFEQATKVVGARSSDLADENERQRECYLRRTSIESEPAMAPSVEFLALVDDVESLTHDSSEINILSPIRARTY